MKFLFNFKKSNLKHWTPEGKTGGYYFSRTLISGGTAREQDAITMDGKTVFGGNFRIIKS
jgi:hypothetical protein